MQMGNREYDDRFDTQTGQQPDSNPTDSEGDELEQGPLSDEEEEEEVTAIEAELQVKIVLLMKPLKCYCLLKG